MTMDESITSVTVNMLAKEFVSTFGYRKGISNWLWIIWTVYECLQHDYQI